MLTRLANPDDLRDVNINIEHDVNEAVEVFPARPR